MRQRVEQISQLGEAIVRHTALPVGQRDNLSYNFLQYIRRVIFSTWPFWEDVDTFPRGRTVPAEVVVVCRDEPREGQPAEWKSLEQVHQFSREQGELRHQGRTHAAGEVLQLIAYLALLPLDDLVAACRGGGGANYTLSTKWETPHVK